MPGESSPSLKTVPGLFGATVSAPDISTRVFRHGRLSAHGFVVYSVIIFATDDNLQKLASSPIWFADGTFKVSPKIFTQVFVIHGMHLDNAYPFVYALLTNKSEESYTTVFMQAKQYFIDNNIATSGDLTIMCDFELAIINAQQYFHLAQSVCRHVQDAGLQAQYRDENDRSIKIGVHSVLGLAFVPTDDVAEALDLLEEDLPDELLGTVEYFDRVYVRGMDH
nr:PREDICTED: uncharacterized protein LOC109040603 [Bemisia tabaci]